MTRVFGESGFGVMGFGETGFGEMGHNPEYRFEMGIRSRL